MKVLDVNSLFHNYKFKSMFFKYFSVFIILIILPAILLGTVAYKGFYDNLNEEVGKANANTLNKALQSIDIVLSNTEKLTELHASDPSLIRYLVNPTAVSLQELGSILNNLSTISDRNSYVLSAYIFNSYNNTILSSMDGVQSLNTFYDREWKEAFDNSSSTVVWMNTRKIRDFGGDEFNCITLVRRLPYSTEGPLGAVVINIDEAKLSSIMKEQNQPGALMYIANQEGKIISHPNKGLLYKSIIIPSHIQDIFNNGTGYFIHKSKDGDILYAYSTSKLMGWKYICELTAPDPLEQVKSTKRLTLLVIAVYILLGLVFAFFMANKFYSPIHRLITSVLKFPVDTGSSVLNKAKGKQNEYVIIEDACSSLLGINSYLEDSLKKTIPFLADKFFRDILLGKKVVELAQMRDLFQKYNMDIEFESFFIMLVQIDSPFIEKEGYEYELYKQLLTKSGRDTVGRNYKGYVADINENLIAAMVNVGSSSETDGIVETIINDMKCSVSGYKDIKITAGIGNVYSNMSDASFSYNEAMEALKRKFYYGKGIIFRYTEIQSPNQYEKYIDLIKEHKFINYVRAKDMKGVTSLIKDVIQEIHARKIDEHFVKQIFSKLVVTTIDTLEDENISIRNIVPDANGIYDAVQRADTLLELEDILTDVFHRIVTLLKDKKASWYIKEIMDYIHENYQRDISLVNVAEKVSLNSSHVSKVFREWTGKNFVEYLATYRINIAKEIMQKEDISMNEVIRKSGFNNMQTFMRTFKKYEGITPGQFKQNLQLSKDLS